MFSGIMSKVVLIQFAVIVCMVGLGYMYYTHSQDTIQKLNQNNAKLETAIQMQEQTIAAQKDAVQKQNAAMFVLQQRLSDAEIKRKDLEARLRRADLQAMARNNAADLEARINRATVQAFRDIETVTAPKDRLAPPAAPETSVDVSSVNKPALVANIVANSNRIANPASKSTASATTNPSNSPHPPPRPPQRAGAPQ
jgi:hypothetical protein